MKLLVIILNKTDALEYLLEGMGAAGIGGATIMRSSGMAMTLSRMESSFLSASIRSMFTGDEEDNRTIISVINDDQLDIARRVVYNTVGDLSQPNTGIMFTVPLDFVEGRRKRRLPQFDLPLETARDEDNDKTAEGPDKKENKAEDKKNEKRK